MKQNLIKFFYKYIAPTLYYLKILNRYNPYCKYCSSCGETGCCSATICINHKKGKYCETNQEELKEYYWILKDFWRWADENNKKEILDKLSELYENNTWNKK